MREIITLNKALVDVALGALAFFCNVDRTAVPITRTLCVLVFCVSAWVVLAFCALFSPAFLGGNDVTERFSEIAPVLILSCPLLWTALRHIQVILEIFDSVLGSITLSSESLSDLRGLYDRPLSFAETKKIHVSVHMVQRLNSDFPEFAFVRRVAQLDEYHSMFGSDERMEPGIDEDGCAEALDSMVIEWRTEYLPLASERTLFLPRHVWIRTKVRECFIYDSIEDNSKITRGIVSWLAFFVRRMMFAGRVLAIRWPPHAVYADQVERVDNVLVGLSTSAGLAGEIPMLLKVRRFCLQLPAKIVEIVQSIVSSTISVVDAVIGETTSFLLIFVLEAIHPLEIRRKHAWDLFRTKRAVVCDILHRRKCFFEYGHMVFHSELHRITVIRYITTVMRKKPNLAAMAFVMLHVGLKWRRLHAGVRKPRKRIRNIISFGVEDADVFPHIAPNDVSFMVQSSSGTVIDFEAAASSGSIPFVVVSPRVLDCARMRGMSVAEGGGEVGQIGRALYATLLAPNSQECQDAIDESVLEFCTDGWSTSNFQTTRESCYFSTEAYSITDELKTAMDKMIDVAKDCHVAALHTYLSRPYISSTLQRNSYTRHRFNMDETSDLLEKIEQHELLVACHRNEMFAIAWLFIDDVLASEWDSWHKWALSNAFDLASLVFDSSPG